MIKFTSWETLGHLGDVLGLGALHVIFRREDQRTKAGVEGHRQPGADGQIHRWGSLFVAGLSLLISKVDLEAHHLPLIQMGYQLTELRGDGAMEIHTGTQKKPGIGKHRLGYHWGFSIRLEGSCITRANPWVRWKYSSRMAGEMM